MRLRPGAGNLPSGIFEGGAGLAWPRRGLTPVAAWDEGGPVKRLLLLVPLATLACQDSAKPAPAATPTAAQAAPKPAPVAKTPLAVGDATPQVTLTLHDGSTFDFAEHTDAFVFVYFYPKDNTPGCTVEAQGLRDQYAALTAAGVTVIGVSMQDADSHKAFIEQHKLPFSLAVDDGSAAKAFDVPVNGEFASRHSFLLKGGKVVQAWRTVDPSVHAQQVLAAVTGA